MPVGGMAQQPPAPRGCDGLAVIAGLSPVIVVMASRSILLGHGVAPGGTRYADRLKGSMDLEPMKIAGVVGCDVWVGPENMVKMMFI